MNCFGYYKERKAKEWFNSEEGRIFYKAKTKIETEIETIKSILIRCGCFEARNMPPPPGIKENSWITGDYKGDNGYTLGIFVNYFDEENGGRVEISTSDKERGREVQKEIEKKLPQINCTLLSTCTS